MQHLRNLPSIEVFDFDIYHYVLAANQEKGKYVIRLGNRDTSCDILKKIICWEDEYKQRLKPCVGGTIYILRDRKTVFFTEDAEDDGCSHKEIVVSLLNSHSLFLKMRNFIKL
jgi:hypothetical protein